MKKFIIVILAAAGIVTYLLNRKKTPVNNTGTVEQSHHLTKVFSKAKQHAINS